MATGATRRAATERDSSQYADIILINLKALNTAGTFAWVRRLTPRPLPARFFTNYLVELGQKVSSEVMLLLPHDYRLIWRTAYDGT